MKDNFPRVLSLKSLLNISVCYNEYLDLKSWKFIIISFINFSIIETNVKRKELDEFHVLVNSFDNLFKASFEFKEEVILLIMEALKDLI